MKGEEDEINFSNNTIDEKYNAITKEINQSILFLKETLHSHRSNTNV